jgi:hypothetical protein
MPLSIAGIVQLPVIWLENIKTNSWASFTGAVKGLVIKCSKISLEPNRLK